MNNWSISQKIYIPLFGGIIIGFILILFSSFLSIKGIEKDVYENEQEANFLPSHAIVVIDNSLTSLL
jgi:methyl-accepting chemotaxis protein